MPVLAGTFAIEPRRALISGLGQGQTEQEFFARLFHVYSASTRQSLITWSWPPEARRRLSGLNATELMTLVWPK
jgi:hypothetical protein